MGGRFCSLDQLNKKFSGNDALPSPKLNEDQKQDQGLRRKVKSIFSEIRSRPKKKDLRFIFGRKFVGSFSLGWLFFLCSSSAQFMMGGRLNFDGGTLNLDGGTLTLDGGTRLPASPCNLSTGTFYHIATY